MLITTVRSARGGIARAIRAPIYPPAIAPASTVAAGPHAITPVLAKTATATAEATVEEGVLDRVGLVQIIEPAERQHRHQQNAQPGAEKPAIDGDHEINGEQEGRGHMPAAVLEHPTTQLRPERKEQGGDQDEPGNELAKDRIARYDEQNRPGNRTGGEGRRTLAQAGALAGEFGTIAEEARRMTRPNGDGARRIRDHGRKPHGHQGREGEEGPPAGHGVAGPADEPGKEQETEIGGGHAAPRPRRTSVTLVPLARLAPAFNFPNLLTACLSADRARLDANRDGPAGRSSARGQ